MIKQVKDKTELELINSSISYTESFLHKLNLEKQLLDKFIKSLNKKRGKMLKYRWKKWHIPPFNEDSREDV